MTFVYTNNVSELESEDIKKIINSIPPKVKASVMTTYARIKEESEQIGIQKGRQIF